MDKLANKYVGLHNISLRQTDRQAPLDLLYTISSASWEIKIKYEEVKQKTDEQKTNPQNSQKRFC